MKQEPEEKRPLKKVLRDWAESFSVAILLALCIKVFFFEIYKIPTSSMEPTLIGKLYGGDRIIVNKMKYRFRDPRRWDVFVFHSPAGENKNLIKRLTGLPGEALSVMNGDIFINSTLLPQEKPRDVQKSVYIKNEDIRFSDSGWKYRFKPVSLSAEVISEGQEDLLSIRCAGRGSLNYTRPITNFYLREGAGQIVCTHMYGSSEYYRIPEASTLNSVISCPAPDCDRKVDLFSLKNTVYSIQIRQEKSIVPGVYEPLPYDSTPVGDMKISFDLYCASCTGYAGCIIRENSREYMFMLVSETRDQESILLIKDTVSEKILESCVIPVKIYNGFRGSVGFENCDNRESVYINGTRVYSRVFRLGPPPPISTASGFKLIFRDFSGTLDNVELYRDIYYTNNMNGGMNGRWGVVPDEPVRLEEDEYFAMGDNSANSRDSRYFGPVQRKLIMGTGLMIFPWFKRYIPPEFTDRWKVVH